ncbi:MAG: amino acid adenylation domain-containing protein, partial [Thermoanaerobaculia bacterium]
SVWEIWGALLYGGRLVVVPYWVSRSPEAFHELLVREGVTVLNQTPSAFRQLVQADGERGGELALRYVVFGGEALELSSLAPWFDRHGDGKPLLVNMYGITETTVHVTWRVVRREDLAAVGRSPVGVPIPDLCVHLRDRHGNLVPVGVAGEMYVAGAGVARGYLGRPELTAERFVPDPFGDSGERLYRSGDLARWLDGGDLEYLGRIDHQVKIRGFRIELGEIEAVLGSHPSVREAVVLPREDASGDRWLVGYVVPREGGLDLADLREHLKDRLPDYMVPSALVEIPAVPLTAHGKVDRKALPDPAEAVVLAEKGFDPPRTPTEELVAGIWSEVLRVERVGRGDSFFDLGGHSLLATRVLSRLREVLAVDLPLRVLFESPTVAELAPRIEAARVAGGIELPPLVPISREGDLPLSFSQERLWFLEQLQPGTAVYHIPNAVRMTGALDVEALRRSIAEVVRRHEALRTVFAARGGRPVQVVRDDLRPGLPLVDLSAFPDPKAEIRRLSAAISRRPFDLAAGPLLRLALLRLGEGEHVLLLTFHHIVSDAWSLEVLLRELAALYPAFSSGRPSPLPELPVQYADFASWQRSWLHGDVLEEQLAYWRERLVGVPVLQLPADHPRPTLQSYHGSMVPFALPEPLSAAVHALARSKGATVFMVLLAAYEALLARYSGQDDFAVGSPVAGRDRREIEGLIGFFVNTLVLRSSLGGDLDAVKLLDRVRAVALEGYARQSVPFERIVQELAPERNLSFSPLFQVMLAFQSLGGEALELPGLTLAPQSDEFPVSKFDLTLTALDSGSQIFGHWVYSTALFERETVARWSGHFQVLLEGLVTNPAQRVSELPLLTAPEREQILVEWNRPPADYPEEGFVHRLFESQAEKTPEAVAVVFEGESLTYRELNARANRLARHLRRRGAGPEVLVGIRAERSFEMVVGLLAILKAGSAYLPLDPSLPEERLSYMMEDAGIELLLTEDLPDCGEESAENLAVPILPDHPAYVIYTSGSTGQPKGVVVSHRALGNRLQYARAGDVLANDAFLQKTTISFDVSLLEIFAPLVIGGRTVLARPGGQQDPEYLVRLIREQRITYTSFPPSLLLALLEQGSFDRCDSLRVVITGGETVPAVLPGQFYERLPGASLLNRYGPTEATISVTSWLCERGVTPRILPIGWPTAKARVYLLDANLQPVPAGITGEILLGGICVARGYLRRPDLTAERFVPDPFGGEAGARLYRTGDLARYRADGAVEFVGRADQQVKIRGFRVELGEIEAVLARHPAVQEVAVVDREDGPTRSLAAYLVLYPGEEPGDAELRSFLAESLPAYMMPADFVVLESLPLSPTGKVDRKALPAPRRRGSAAGFAAPRTPTEELLAAIWAGLLGIERVGTGESFFDLGGHSLLATQVISRVREAFGVELPLRVLFERPTVAEMAEEVAAAVLAGAGVAAPPLVPAPRDGELPLSFAQQRLWFLEQLQPGTSTYNMPSAVRFHGALDVAALHNSLREVARRHESLRTSFAIQGGRPVQSIAAELDLDMPLLDLGEVPEERLAAAVRQLTEEEGRRPFDLARGPLVRAALLRLREDEHVAILTTHHIVSDGWSIGVLIREIAALYPAFLAGEPSPLPELEIQYADFAVWQREWLRGDLLESQLSYWRQRLAGHTLLELPTDHPRPAVQRFRGADEFLALPAEASRAFLAFGQRQGATPYMSLLAGFMALLQRYSGQDDVILGSTVAGRDRRELEPLIGFFVNTLAMRADLSGRPSFRELLSRVREVALGALSHQYLPFEKLVEELQPERDLSRSPLFQVVFQLQNVISTALELPGLTLSPVEASSQTAKFDIVLNLREGAQGLGGVWRYNTDLFDRATLARMSRHLESLLAGAAAAPDRSVAELPLLTEAERRQLGLEEGAALPESLDGPCLHEVFAAQAARSPEAVAVSCEGSALSYGELDAQANRLAWHLVGLGISPGDLVGLCLERSLDMVVAILGVLKAGGAYVPLDPAYPSERLAFMLEDSRVPVLLTQESLAELLPETVRKVFLERISGESEDAPEIPVSADHPAYVIYTSGSTGKPKGVVVRHGNVTRLFTATDPWFGFGAEDVWTLFHSYAFDFSVWEIWGALLYGGRLVVVPYWVSRSPEAFHELLVNEQVTVLNQTPSAFRQLIWADRSAPDLALRYVVFGGEALEPASLVPWFERHGDQTPRLINMYGITETTVHVTYRPIGWEEARGSGSVIGRPIPDLGLYVLDANGQPLPVGVPGEIHVGGAGLALGYLGRPELTAQRFVPNPWGEPGSRLYRSGDLARFLANGDLEYLGRIDHQVKIRGFRIELGEVESALASQASVREAVVLAREDGAERRLVAYVVADEEAPTLPELREALAASLPEYMLPSALVVLEAMPLTANGKVDRKALPAPDAPRPGLGGSYEEPATDLERFLAGLWREVLGLQQAGLRDDFFALGGSSISGAVLVNRLQEELREIVQVVVIFDAPTIAELAAYLIEQHPAAVERLFGAEALGGRRAGEAAEKPVDEAGLQTLRGLVRPLAPRMRVSPKNPPAVFVLSPPRSGSTLLRVMLGGHPKLFSPPELELLSFNTLQERRKAFSGRDAFWLEGVIRAVMEIRGCDAAEAEALVEDCEREDLTALEFYGRMQEWLGGRMLVDKTPSYALDPAILRRAEEGFEEPLYIHLIRHPMGMIHSFEEAKLDQIFFRQEHPFSRRQLAELIWLASHENIVEHLRGVPAGRQHWVRFEDLLREPEAAMRGICAFLGLDYHPDMAEPYKERPARMTDGIHAESRMLGDVKFHEHKSVDRSTAESWRQHYTRDFLGDVTWRLASELGYEDERTGAGLAPIEPGGWSEGEPLPLSSPQERLWFFEQMEPGSPVYHIPAVFRLSGRLDAPALAASLREVVHRHAALRTTFTLAAGEPAQTVSPEVEIPLGVADLSALPRERRQAEALRLAHELVRQPFDLVRGPLLRAALLRLGPEEHAAVFTMHHIVSDGWSMGVLIREVAELYRSFLSGEPARLPALPIQYPDYALWQRRWMRGPVLERQIAFWRQALAGAATLQLPADRPRPRVQTYRGGTETFHLPAAVSERLVQLGREEGATPFMALLAGYSALLARYSGQEDISVGSPVANRNRAETEPLIGLFINMVVLRGDLSGDPAFQELIRRTRSSALAALRHQDMPFARLVEELQPERDLSRAPLFQVMLVQQSPHGEALSLPGLTLQALEGLEGSTSKVDLTLSVGETPQGMLGLVYYNRDLFDAATVSRLAGHLGVLLGAAVADPGLRLSELPLLTASEKEQIRDWNDTAVSCGLDVCLHELIETQVERSPDAVAVTVEAGSLTYRELSAAANRLARRLIEMGVGPEIPVGVFAERSLEMVVALLGILKAGGAYLPVDPDYPADRVAYMLEDSKVPVVLTQDRLLGKLPETGARVVLLSDEAGDSSAPVTGVRPGNLAYVIYTSGSTGRPKGTMNSHRGIVNRLLWMQQEYGLTPADRVLQKTPFSFDVSVWEFFWPLLTGARLVMAKPGGHQDPSYLVRTINAEGITTMHFVPSMLQVFLEAPEVESCASLVRVMASGEALPYELQRRFYVRLGAGLHNLYGPTEAAVDVTYWACEREGRRALVPIGRPVANTRIHLLDASLRPVPVGVPGELYIGGIQVGRGYLGRPELTAERFVPDPFSAEPGARLYRTGDLARYLPDGAVDFLGRIDHQVKLRGLRIELGEIEAAITAHPSVREAVVLVRTEGGALGAVNLVAYVTGDPDPAALKALLGRSLPEYMVPAAWVVMDELPLSPNGKIDRKALSKIAPERKAGEVAERVAPRTELERALAGLWSETLDLATDGFGIHDSFFELGGNSITGAILINRLQERLGEIVHVVAIFDAPTVAALAAHLGREYPQAVARIWGADSLGEAGAAGEVLAPPLDEERLADVQGLIRTLSPAVLAPEKNPPAVFVLSPPRSGSTLLRVMLGGNPLLFAPPELELLNFNTLAERREAFPGRDAFRLEGLLRAVMEIQGTGPEAARELIERFEGEEMTTQDLYRRLQEWIQPRLLVDKTPTYAWDPATLQRAEEAFEDARYIHLVRHPYGMIRSFEEARIDQIFFSLDHPFSRRELAEALWVIAHRNIASFL